MKYNKNKALTILTMGMAAVSCTSQSAKQEDKRPNILFIMSDDHAYQAISAYGYGLNETPNIDRLAEGGAIFTRACVTNSISAPSRAVLLTGETQFCKRKGR
jgi:arylsulfatase A-like enzyme